MPHEFLHRLDLKTTLRRGGIVKSDVDLLIATIALVDGATLVTNDAALLARDVPDPSGRELDVNRSKTGGSG